MADSIPKLCWVGLNALIYYCKRSFSFCLSKPDWCHGTWREPRSREARSCGKGALTGGAQLASPGWDMKLHWARSHIRAIRGTVTLLCLSCWGRSDLSQQFQVLQDNLRREGWCRVSFAFQIHVEGIRWEANTKSQHTEKGIVKEGYLQNSKWKFQMCAERWGRKDNREKTTSFCSENPKEAYEMKSN